MTEILVVENRNRPRDLSVVVGRRPRGKFPLTELVRMAQVVKFFFDHYKPEMVHIEAGSDIYSDIADSLVNVGVRVPDPLDEEKPFESEE